MRKLVFIRMGEMRSRESDLLGWGGSCGMSGCISISIRGRCSAIALVEVLCCGVQLAVLPVLQEVGRCMHAMSVSWPHRPGSPVMPSSQMKSGQRSGALCKRETPAAAIPFLQARLHTSRPGPKGFQAPSNEMRTCGGGSLIALVHGFLMLPRVELPPHCWILLPRLKIRLHLYPPLGTNKLTPAERLRTVKAIDSITAALARQPRQPLFQVPDRPQQVHLDSGFRRQAREAGGWHSSGTCPSSYLGAPPAGEVRLELLLGVLGSDVIRQLPHELLVRQRPSASPAPPPQPPQRWTSLSPLCPPGHSGQHTGALKGARMVRVCSWPVHFSRGLTDLAV